MNEARRATGISRRKFLRMGGGIAGAAALGGVLAGCGGGGEDAGGAVKITLGFIPDEAGGLQKILDRFNRENRGEIQVEWRQMPASSAEFFEQMQAELQSGQSTMDVIGGDVVWPAQFAANGYILDLSDRFTQKMQRDYLEGPIQAVQYEGKTYGVPWFTDAGMFYYRTDLLEKSGFSGPPKTWEEMKSMSEKVRADQGTKFGFVFQGAQDEGGVVDALEHIWNAGGDVLDGNKVIIDSPESAEGLNLRRSLLTDGVAPQASGDYTTQESQASFTNGDVVFMRNWPFVYGLLSDPETSEIKPGQVDIGALPVAGAGDTSFSGLGGWNFMVNAAAEDKIEEIWAFIEYMSAPEQQQTFAVESARLPTLRSLYEDDEVLDKLPVARLGQEALQNTRPRPVSPVYSDMSLEMAEQFNAALKGEVSVDKALAELQTGLQEISDQA
ncbi:MAG: Maltodextrin ABC transporter, substrate-binding protein MdxE [uncultured Rubrobacteraceae bacterium]|uniref:Maltodextrin ABC transporter, substrate-binding protein MdxE n=1 Tax=uncultured Rubrobacteraceae bacterium TaxID=349277 RepID=A0A6J4QH10_9ACTN|nr:MAG: Maltodextrin ABC transporter, substrate-binding protein MdxE [uncultured Rubrobacteraceae bacterium]